jgi:hypothetical protein
MKPADDLCLECQTLCKAITNTGHLPEEEKRERLLAYQQHLNEAKQERECYNQQIAMCKATIGKGGGSMHYSYDFAQQIHYPNNPLQPGPAYFLSARKCQVFGVACEPEGTQVNYLIDEADNVGKGANCTISLFHHYLECHASQDVTNIYIHADNCVGQNKNNTTIQYLAWRVITGKHKHITLSFMMPGHTKFAPDRHFGLLKKSYRRTRVDTMGCIAEAVKNSSHVGANRVQLVRNLSGDQLVHFYNWSEFFSLFFTSLPSITSYHVFYFDCDLPGTVFVKCRSTDPSYQEFTIQRPSSILPTPSQFPIEVVPSGLTVDRQWYLYEKIRQFCSSNLAADLTCPKPLAPKHSTATQTSGKRSASKTASSKTKRSK